MLTGMDKPTDQLRGFAHGADASLTKPCEYLELLKTVALLLGETVPA
jgi:DNA-binding response OmpR family regulator